MLVESVLILDKSDEWSCKRILYFLIVIKLVMVVSGVMRLGFFYENGLEYIKEKK